MNPLESLGGTVLAIALAYLAKIVAGVLATPTQSSRLKQRYLRLLGEGT